MESRYDRQERIPKWDQKALTNATVLLAGAGALGNEILKNLALMGIGKILVVDFDHIELSNLSRTVLFRDNNLGQSKAAAAAAAAIALNPEIDVRYIHGNLFFDIGMGFYRHADLIISGLDNIAARSKVGQCAYLCGKPFIDSGLWDLGGEIRVFWPGQGFCFDCTLGDTDWQNAHLRRSCTGFRPLIAGDEGPAPSNAATTSIIGGLVAQETVRWLSGRAGLESGDALVFNGLRQSLHSSRLPGDDPCSCRLGQPFDNVISIDSAAGATTAEEFWEFAKTYIGTPERIELGRDLVLGYDDNCDRAACPARSNPFKPTLMAKIPESDPLCTLCGRNREARIISSYGEDFPDRHLSLKNLGVPPGEILAAWNREATCYLELKRDVTDFWKADLLV